MAAFILCLIVITFAFGSIFVLDGFGQPLEKTRNKLIKLKAEYDEEEDKEE